MRILKIKDWKESKKPAFKVINDPPSGQTAIQRLKDGKIFERFHFYYDYKDGLYYDIMLVNRDKIHVNIRIYRKVGDMYTYVTQKKIHIDEL